MLNFDTSNRRRASTTFGAGAQIAGERRRTSTISNIRVNITAFDRCICVRQASAGDALISIDGRDKCLTRRYEALVRRALKQRNLMNNTKHDKMSTI